MVGELGRPHPALVREDLPASPAAGAIDRYLAALSLALRRHCAGCLATAGVGWQAAIALCPACREMVEEVGADLDAAAYEHTLGGLARPQAEAAAVADLLPPAALAQLLLPSASVSATAPRARVTGITWVAAAVLPVLVSVSLIGWAALVPVVAVLAATAGSQVWGAAGAIAAVAAVVAVSWGLVRAGNALAVS